MFQPTVRGRLPLNSVVRSLKTTNPISIKLKEIALPPACCRCNSAEHSVVPYSDQIVIAALGGVALSRNVTIPIPICKRCNSSKRLWYSLAAAAFFMSALLGIAFPKVPNLDTVGAVLFVFSVVALVIGYWRRPLKMIGYDPESDLLKLAFFNDEFAAAFANVNRSYG